MPRTETSLSEALIAKVGDWLEDSALEGMELETIVTGTCERLAAAGMPLKRVHLSFSMLHPLYDALGFTWVRGGKVSVQGVRVGPGGPRADMFLASPYFHLLKNKLDHLRRRIEPEGEVEFPVFEDLRALGVTDYLAFVQHFGGDVHGRGMLGSWSTDAADGFQDDEISALLHLQAKLAVTAKMAVLNQLAENMMSTYLGESAGRRVLSGQTRRGDGETIRAVLAMGDLRDSTKLAEQEGREVYIDTLNAFFDAVATPFTQNGGEILSFVGDGFIAVFPTERHSEPSQIAARAAMAAARQASLRVDALNAEREAQGQAPVRFGMGLHVGNVMFGNVGLKNRLTFSAFGTAVNEVQRLQALTKSVGEVVIASQEFVDYTPGEWESLGEVQLRGMQDAVTVHRPKVPAEEIAPQPRQVAEGDGKLSEAEELMLLFRNSLERAGLPGRRVN